ncbi:hypothetical protein ACN082_09925 [Rothia sp. CCM 9417]|uniref:hypothetical protein n=1 Tax=unclassified Rothia (in: high G+C Gram-positive bacteria) TaxID=2689056 RepID=UPI003AD4DC38
MTEIDPTLNLEEMTPEQVDEVLEQLEYHRAEVARIEAALKENPALTVETGTWRVNVATGSRFDAAAFEREYPVEEHPDFYIPQPPKLDAKKVDPQVKAQYTKETAPRLTIKKLTN